MLQSLVYMYSKNKTIRQNFFRNTDGLFYFFSEQSENFISP